ncbi:hypothetical protein M758_6G084200 [Ceratodon purpureus]|nr:hypothetical protein M758_6G084200 [Ceratodon purpureus]
MRLRALIISISSRLLAASRLLCIRFSTPSLISSIFNSASPSSSIPTKRALILSPRLSVSFNFWRLAFSALGIKRRSPNPQVNPCICFP